MNSGLILLAESPSFWTRPLAVTCERSFLLPRTFSYVGWDGAEIDEGMSDAEMSGGMSDAEMDEGEMSFKQCEVASGGDNAEKI